MKVLFVSSGNSGNISPIVSTQGKTIEENGICVNYFLIQGKGVIGYIKNILKLRRYIKENDFDIIHAHYSFTAYVSALATASPLVVSLMGSDVKGSKLQRIVIKLFKMFFWSAVIVKSEDMKKSLNSDDIYVIPNGVDLKQFKPMYRKDCQNQLKWDKQKIHVLFGADPESAVKNYKLFLDSVENIKYEFPNIEVHYLKNIPRELVPIYINASNVVCLSSKWEGSPNIVKEAMACNRSIVCTNVGDVKWLFGKIDGCYLSSCGNKNEYSKMLLKAIEFSRSKKNSNGRARIIKLGLCSNIIANRISDIYNTVTEED